jgi:hypothetical protein
MDVIHSEIPYYERMVELARAWDRAVPVIQDNSGAISVPTDMYTALKQRWIQITNGIDDSQGARDTWQDCFLTPLYYKCRQRWGPTANTSESSPVSHRQVRGALESILSHHAPLPNDVVTSGTGGNDTIEAKQEAEAEAEETMVVPSATPLDDGVSMEQQTVQ